MPLAATACEAHDRRLGAAELERVGDQVLEQRDQQRALAAHDRQAVRLDAGRRCSSSTPRQRRALASASDARRARPARARVRSVPTRENASRSLISACIRFAPSTANSMYWSARSSSWPLRSGSAAPGRSSRPCAAAPAGRARRRRRTARARRSSASARAPAPRAPRAPIRRSPARRTMRRRIASISTPSSTTSAARPRSPAAAEVARGDAVRRRAPAAASGRVIDAAQDQSRRRARCQGSATPAMISSACRKFAPLFRLGARAGEPAASRSARSAARASCGRVEQPLCPSASAESRPCGAVGGPTQDRRDEPGLPCQRARLRCRARRAPAAGPARGLSRFELAVGLRLSARSPFSYGSRNCRLPSGCTRARPSPR